MEEIKTQVAPVSITDAAIAEMKKLKTELEVPEGYHLRLGVKAGGCSGFSYMLVFDEKQEGDSLFVFDDLSVVLHKDHINYINGMQVDFVDGLENRGFTFTNPNAQSSCGCGDSFSV